MTKKASSAEIMDALEALYYAWRGVEYQIPDQREAMERAFAIIKEQMR